MRESVRAPSIQASLSRWFAIQTFVGLIVVCTAIYGITAWSFKVKQQSEFERHVELVVHLLQEPGSKEDPKGLRHKLDDFFRSHSDVGIVLSVNGRLFFSSRPTQKSAQWVWLSRDLRDVVEIDTATTLQIGIDVQEDSSLLRRLGWTLLGAAVLGSMLVSLTGALLVRRGLRPLQRLAQQTASTGPEFPDRRIDAMSYAPELVPWIAQFNAVLERAEHAYQQLEAFNADVAHELRTPLANIIAEAEVELSRPRTADALRESLISNLEEARRLSAIVTDMLFLSRSDRGESARRSAPVRLTELIHDVVEFHEAELEQARLEVRVLSEAIVSIDVALVRRAVSNLLGNAIRYALPDSSIDVSIHNEDGATWIRVSNSGPQVSSDALPHLFKRFYRAERSRARSSAHHGLGLAIVAAIAKMHGGKTEARSSTSVTTIAFSLANSPGESSTAPAGSLGESQYS